MPACKTCGVEISLEQHGKYFKRCDACYRKYKATTIKIQFVLGIAMFLLSLGYMAIQYPDYALGFFVIGQMSWCQALIIRTSEFVHWKWDKKGTAARVLVMLPSVILVLVLMISPFVSLIGSTL